ncbi:TIGR00269 family protein [Candidatus Woesearchaeota archaeon]|nr:TIGR00269 family protein [Candidatus Woesearchaeota archaeon]
MQKLTKTELKFTNKIEKKIKKTIDKYILFNKKDKILVAASGGKDSTVMLYVLKKLGYDFEAITINSFIGNYSKQSLENLVSFCEEMDIKLHHISLRDEFGYSLCYIRSILKSKGINLKSCTICGVLRRYLLNKYSRKLGANKLVLGHNLDDEAQVFMMNLLRGDFSVSARLGPITGVVQSEKFVQRVKPLYFIRETDIEKYSKIQKFPVKYGECPCSYDSLRRSMKEVLSSLEIINPQVRENIIDSFLRILPVLKKVYKIEKDIETCKKCGEPTSQNICKTCQIIYNLKND